MTIDQLRRRSWRHFRKVDRHGLWHIQRNDTNRILWRRNDRCGTVHAGPLHSLLPSFFVQSTPKSRHVESSASEARSVWRPRRTGGSGDFHGEDTNRAALCCSAGCWPARSPAGAPGRHAEGILSERAPKGLHQQQDIEHNNHRCHQRAQRRRQAVVHQRPHNIAAPRKEQQRQDGKRQCKA